MYMRRNGKKRDPPAAVGLTPEQTNREHQGVPDVPTPPNVPLFNPPTLVDATSSTPSWTTTRTGSGDGTGLPLYVPPRHSSVSGQNNTLIADIERAVISVELEKARSCSVCGGTYANQGLLNNHFKAVHGPKQQCKVCKNWFSNIHNLRRHLRVMHDVVEDTPVMDAHMKARQFNPENKHVCHLCDQRYKYAHAIKQHYKSKHATLADVQAYENAQLEFPTWLPDKLRYRCGKCSKATEEGVWFTSKDMYLRHMFFQHQSVCYMCPGCNEVFKTKFSLSYHTFMNLCPQQMIMAQCLYSGVSGVSASVCACDGECVRVLWCVLRLQAGHGATCAGETPGQGEHSMGHT